MSIARTLTLSAVTALSTVVVAFVATDRLSHGPVVAPTDRKVEVRPVEPETTGTVAPIVTQQAVPAAKPARLVNGFDTDRLNALMRGEFPEPPPPAAGRRR